MITFPLSARNATTPAKIALVVIAQTAKNATLLPLYVISRIHSANVYAMTAILTTELTLNAPSVTGNAKPVMDPVNQIAYYAIMFKILEFWFQMSVYALMGFMKTLHSGTEFVRRVMYLVKDALDQTLEIV